MDFNLATSKEICQELGLRLKAWRLTKNIKQEELAGRAGVSVGTIKNIESKGQVSLLTWIQVIIALDLTKDIEILFKSKAKSIADMEREEEYKYKNLKRRAR